MFKLKPLYIKLDLEGCLIATWFSHYYLKFTINIYEFWYGQFSLLFNFLLETNSHNFCCAMYMYLIEIWLGQMLIKEEFLLIFCILFLCSFFFFFNFITQWPKYLIYFLIRYESNIEMREGMGQLGQQDSHWKSMASWVGMTN